MNTSSTLMSMVHGLNSNVWNVLDIIFMSGGRPLIVGGSIRDALISGTIVPKDIDIEVHQGNAPYFLTMSKLVSILSRVGKVDQVGVSFGVLKVTVGGETIDVSVPRKDSKVSDGHTGFIVDTESPVTLEEAFARRDFTMNAIGLDPFTGEVIDPFDGIKDIQNKIIRHTSEAFVEDPLRVLRAVQFAGRFGFIVSRETLDLCNNMVDQFKDLAIERVWVEWEKVLKSKHPDLAIQILEETGWDVHFPGVRKMQSWYRATKEGYFYHASAGEIYSNVQDRMIAVAGNLLLGFSVEDTDAFTHSIGAPVWLSKALRNINDLTPSRISGLTPDQVLRAVEKRGVTFAQWHSVWSSSDQWVGSQIFREKGTTDPRATPRVITGQDLIARGLKPGPVFKEILEEAEAFQDVNNITPEVAQWWLDNKIASL